MAAEPATTPSFVDLASATVRSRKEAKDTHNCATEGEVAKTPTFGPAAFGPQDRATFMDLASTLREEVKDARHCAVAPGHRAVAPDPAEAPPRFGLSDCAAFVDPASATTGNRSREEVKDAHLSATSTSGLPGRTATLMDLASVTEGDWSREEAEDASDAEPAGVQEHTSLTHELEQRAEDAGRQAQSSRVTLMRAEEEEAPDFMELSNIVDKVLTSNEIKKMMRSYVKHAVRKELESIILCMDNIERTISFRLDRLEAAIEKVWECQDTKAASPQPHPGLSTKKMPHIGHTSLEPVPEDSAAPCTKGPRPLSPIPRQQLPGLSSSATHTTPADTHQLDAPARDADRLEGEREPSLPQKHRSGRKYHRITAEEVVYSQLPQQLRQPRCPPSTCSRDDGLSRCLAPAIMGSQSSDRSVSALSSDSESSGGSTVDRDSSWSSGGSDHHVTDDMSSWPRGSTVDRDSSWSSGGSDHHVTDDMSSWPHGCAVDRDFSWSSGGSDHHGTDNMSTLPHGSNEDLLSEKTSSYSEVS